MEDTFKHSVVEALIMASPEPLQGKKIADVIDGMTSSKVSKAVAELNNRYMESGSSYRIRELAGGYQFYILSEFAGFVEDMFARRRKMRLTRASLETLAIVAYKQPVTKNEIELIRGVASDGVLHNLLEKNMLTIKGRASTVGKPLQYGTTDEFLKFFGLNKIEDMPKMSEIEALIAAEEEQAHSELYFDEQTESEEGMPLVKLNIADGTYNPEEENENSNPLKEAEKIIHENTNTEQVENSEDNLEDKEDLVEVSESDEAVIIDLDQT